MKYFIHLTLTIIFALSLGCATHNIQAQEGESKADILSDLEWICRDLAANANNRVGNGDTANNRVGNGAPVSTASAFAKKTTILPSFLKTSTGRQVFAVSESQRSAAAEGVARQLGETYFSCD